MVVEEREGGGMSRERSEPQPPPPLSHTTAVSSAAGGHAPVTSLRPTGSGLDAKAPGRGKAAFASLCSPVF